MNADNMMRKEPALYADILAALGRGAAEVLYDGQTAILVRVLPSGVYLLGAEDPELGKTLLAGLDLTEGEAVIRGEALREYAEQALGLEVCEACVQVYYDKPAAPPAEGPLEIRHPDPGDFEKVLATYDLVSPEHLREDFEQPDFLGGYLDGTLAAYIGLHTEGSMGMLQVFPPFRRRGFARQIYAALIQNQLDKGRIPYAHIYRSNRASLALQDAFGFKRSSEFIYWVWKPGR